MAAKTGLLVYVDDEVPDLLRGPGAPDLAGPSDMMRRLYRGSEIEPCEGAELWDGLYPPKGTAHAASWPGAGVVGDPRMVIDFPSRLAEHLVAASAGRGLVLHTMPYPLPFHPWNLVKRPCAPSADSSWKTALNPTASTRSP